MTVWLALIGLLGCLGLGDFIRCSVCILWFGFVIWCGVLLVFTLFVFGGFAGCLYC